VTHDRLGAQAELRTVVELLRRWAAERPERSAYTWLRDGEVE